MRVVNCKTDACDIYIGRPSRWGNPYSDKEGTLAEFTVSSRDEAVTKYREYVLARPDIDEFLSELLEAETLGCWCAPLRCHGDVLIELIRERFGPRQMGIPGL